MRRMRRRFCRCEPCTWDHWSDPYGADCCMGTYIERFHRRCPERTHRQYARSQTPNGLVGWWRLQLRPYPRPCPVCGFRQLGCARLYAQHSSWCALTQREVLDIKLWTHQ